jgi:hypothetical protein
MECGAGFSAKRNETLRLGHIGWSGGFKKNPAPLDTVRNSDRSPANFPVA